MGIEKIRIETDRLYIDRYRDSLRHKEGVYLDMLRQITR